MSAINYPNINIPTQNNPVLGITAPTIHSNYQDLMDTYNEIQDMKDNSIAVTIANHRKNKERIGATAIGFIWGTLTGCLLSGGYALVKAFPIAQKLTPVKWLVGNVDKWIIKARKSYPEKSRLYHLTTGVGAKVLYSALTSAALGFIFDMYKTYSNTRINGKVSNTKQGLTGDCYLLSGLNSLSYSKFGREAIKNSIHQNKDNTITVTLKGVNKDYTITNQELKQASKKYVPDLDLDGKVHGYDKKYSTGDGDVLAFELAFEKYRKDLKDGNIKEDKNLPTYAYEFLKNSKNPIENGTTNQVYFLLTGKNCSLIDFSETKDAGITKDFGILKMYSKKSLDNFMINFSKNPKNYAAGCNLKIKESIPFRDKHHQKTKLIPKHAYAIKKINKNSVIIVDPQKSRIPIELPIDMFKSVVGSIWYVDNNVENNDKSLEKFADINSKNDKYINENF